MSVAVGTTSSELRKSRSKGIRTTIVIVGILLTVFAVGTAWLAFQAQQIQESLSSSKALISELRIQLEDGQLEQARTTYSNLHTRTWDAREAAADPLWRFAGHLPIIGSNFSAVSEVALSAQEVIEVLAPLMDESASFDWHSLAPADGRIDTDGIKQVAPHLDAASTALSLSYERLASFDRSALLPQVAQPLEAAMEELSQVSDAFDGAAAAANMLPAMLGDDEPRHYLLLIQNSAEIRATGGIPGALAVITADGGELDLTAQGSASDLPPFDPPLIVDPEQAAIYSSRIGTFIQSVNLTPDFPTAAQTAATMWEKRYDGSSIDGVVALDPIALSYILEATGPVKLSPAEPVDVGRASQILPTELTSDNVVKTLLSDVYAAMEDPADQDDYFASVASEVFSALTAGSGNSESLIPSLIRSADEGRLYLWSSRPDEQDSIASTALAGGVTNGRSGGAAFGAYFNDGTGAKMDYYMKRTAQLHQNCTIDGYLQYTLTATLTNTAPMDAAESLSDYVTGGGYFGVPPGIVQTHIIGYGPYHAQLQSARVNGKLVPLGSYRHSDRPVGVLTTNLAPGQTATVEFDFTKVVQTSMPVLHATPTIQPLSEVVLPLQQDAACGASGRAGEDPTT